MKKYTFFILTLLVASSSFAQRVQSEKVNYYNVKEPNNPLDESVKTYNVVVETPYTLTLEELKEQSLAEFEIEKANYATLVKESEEEYEEKLASYDDDVKRAEEHYDKEMKDFKDLSLLERLALTEQGKKPKLKVPAKPTYVKPREPQYIEPNLNDHLVFDNQVLADGVELLGYKKGNDVLFLINISKMAFKDNGGQTFYSQPTNLKVMKGTEIIDEKNFDEDFKFLTSSSSNTINLERYEKNNVNKIMETVSNYINEEFGYIPVASSIEILFPKNRKREYDILENAKIKAVSAYRKLTKDASAETRERSKAELETVRETWMSELSKIDYSDKRAVMNKDVAIMIFINLMRVDISLKNKANAEEVLRLMQERRIDLDLNYDEKSKFTRLEESIYKL